MNRKLIVVLMLVLLVVMAAPSYALDLVKSDPQDGVSGVALDTELYMLFDKNVVNFKIKEKNAQCFTLFDGQNQVVPIDVIFADDQIEPEKRNEIIVKPQGLLQKGKAYRLEVSPELLAKNGTALGKKIIISFSTAQ